MSNPFTPREIEFLDIRRSGDRHHLPDLHKFCRKGDTDAAVRALQTLRVHDHVDSCLHSKDPPFSPSEYPCANALSLACLFGHADVVRLLVAHRAAVDGAPCDYGGQFNETPLFVAAAWGFVEVVAFLIASRADVNKIGPNGYGPIHGASLNNHPDVTALLLRAGADANLQTLPPTTFVGETALHLACQEGHTAVVSVLIAARADVNSVAHADGTTPLHVACIYDQVDIALLLLLAGADPNRLDCNGRTPLHLARSEKTRAAVRSYL